MFHQLLRVNQFSENQEIGFYYLEIILKNNFAIEIEEGIIIQRNKEWIDVAKIDGMITYYISKI